MKRYEERIITNNELLLEYDSFMFLEGQTGLPDMVEECYKIIKMSGCEHWILENIFEHKDKIKAIPFLNPSVLIFQTTMMSRDKISHIIEYLENQNWKPKEIWQLINNDIPIVDSDRYNVFSFYPDEYKGEIRLIKL